MNIYPYVYRCEHKITKEFYYGSRVANKLPAELDFPKYKTSSNKVKPIFEQFDWFIVAEFFDADSAYEFEQELIYETWDSPISLNASCFYKKMQLRFTSHTEEMKQWMKERVSGTKNPMYGKTPHNKGIPHTQETRDKIRKSKLGLSPSKEIRESISKTMTGKKHPTKIISCPYCEKSGCATNIKRYHFENCKLRELSKINTTPNIII